MEQNKNRRLLFRCLCEIAITIVVLNIFKAFGLLNVRMLRIAKWLLVSILILDLIRLLLLPRFLVKRYKKLMQLTKDDPDRFMEQTGKMLKNPLWRRFYNSIHENRAVTYANAHKDYQRALEEMSLVQPSRYQSPVSRGVYWGNLTEMTFDVGDPEEACRIYEVHQTSIEALDGVHDELLLPLKIRYAIAKGDPEAQDILDRTRTAWESDEERQDWLEELDELQQLLSLQRD